MEVSQEVLNLSNHLHDIHSHFQNEYPREGCGILGIQKGKLHWIPCTNVAKDDEDFVISSKEYFKIVKSYDIVAIVHSHPDADATPSTHDINYCNALCIPYYIFSYPEMDLHILEPEKNHTELFGRSYEFGVRDCFEAMRDYLLSVGVEIPPRRMFEDDWWKKGLDYFTDEVVADWGFRRVEEPQPNDLLIFSVESSVGNHCGVYLGNDVMFHHAEKRLSCRENLYPFWIKTLTGIYRHETQRIS